MENIFMITNFLILLFFSMNGIRYFMAKIGYANFIVIGELGECTKMWVHRIRIWCWLVIC